jgi:cyanoexosortase B
MQMLRSTFPTFDPKRFPWILGAIALVLTLMYAPLLAHWIQGWTKKSISLEHEYFSHGLLGIPFAGYLVWQGRSKLSQLSASLVDQCLGSGLCAVAGMLYLSHLADPVNLSFPTMLVGLALLLKGRSSFAVVGFPLILILLATPNEIPYLIAPYTAPLQIFIAGMAGFILRILGLPVTVDQMFLYINGKQVEVAPYCAGLKMLFTSLYVALLLLDWTGLMRSRQFVAGFLAFTVGISVVGNIIRNTLLTYWHGTGQDGLFVWLHDSWGGDLYSAGILGVLVWAIGKFEDRLSPQPLASPQPPAES